MEKASAFDSNTGGVRRDEEKIKKFIRESDEVSLSWIREALSREENRREARRMDAWIKSGERERAWRSEATTLEEIYEAEIIEEMRNG